ncbi:MAG TPA: alpha/beta hydrolase [Planctomycetota bacterium]|nr:alpha/beta hydrolase [Planctomycetota bacterium]
MSRTMKSMLRLILIVLGALAIGYAALVAAVYLFQDSLIYFPDRDVPSRESVGLGGAEDVALTTDDGKRLSGWYLAPGGTARPAALVLLFHGNAGNVANRAWKLELLARAGFAALVFDYRGYGRSEAAAPDEAGLYADGRAAAAWARERAKALGVPLVYYGESLGCAVAIETALGDPPPAGLALEAPFTSLADVGRHHYGYLPVGLLTRARYDNLGKIGRVRAPVLVVHGEADRTIPVAMGRAIYAAAPEPKELRTIPGGDHNDALYFDSKPLVEGLRALLARGAGAAAAR